MGDRALIIFTNGNEVSPTVYLHWGASQIPEWLEQHKGLMKSRRADVEYAVARFIGIAHTSIEGNLSLGCWNTSEDTAVAVRKSLTEPSGDHIALLKDGSHGDGGLVVVNVTDYSWNAYGGYLVEKKLAA